MPSTVVSFIGSKLVAIGSVLGAGSAGAGVAIAVGATAVVAGAVVAKKLIDNIYAVPNLDSDRSRQATVRGTVEPQKVIYGEALVSGPINFVGVAGTDNRDLYHSIVLAGHPCTSISDIYFDDEVITSNRIDTNGDVTTGTFGPKDGTTICVIRKLLGDQTAADSVLDNAFGTINSTEHIGTNLTYIVTKFTLTDKSQEVWDKFLPNDIKALVKGKKVYDPRQDSTSTYYDADLVGGVSTQRSNDSTTWEWSENPVWCLVDYLTDDRFGMDINLDRIDLSKAVDAADICDVSVSVPGGSEKRYTCNGVVFGTSTHKANINKILSSMNGMLTYTNGKFVIRAGAFEAVATGMTLSDDNLTGPAKLKTSFERGERFNTITGTFIDPDKNYKEIEFPKVQITSALTRDNNEELSKEIKLSMTNSRYMAQRLAHKLIQQSDLQKVLTFPTNLAGVNIAVGDRVSVTLSEFSYTNKTFVCLGWTLSESGSGGVNLVLREDDSSSYADLAQSGYSTVTPAGGIQQGFFGVPDPSGLSATAHIESIELDWTNPANMTGIIAIEVFASPNSSWSSAVKIGETLGTQFIHDESNGVDSIVEGDQRYYWVRARRFPSGEGSDAVSDRNPDSDTSTVQATKGALGNLANLDTVGEAQIDDNAVGSDQINDDEVLHEVPSEGLTYYWPCNSIADVSGGGNEELQEVVAGKTGIHSGSTAPTLSTDSPTGKSVQSDTNSGFTLLSDTDADALEGANGFAWSLWFKSETTSGNSQARIITRDASDGWAVLINQSQTGNQTVTLYGEPGTESMGQVAQGQWHHFCLSEDGNGTISGYVNGELIGTESYTPVVSSRPVVVGTNTESTISTGSENFNGKFTEIRAYNRALTAQEVRGLYKVPAASAPAEVDGDMIVDGSLFAAKLNVDELSAISADLGTITAGDLNIGSGNFTVSSAGVMTATGATVDGAITATSLNVENATVTGTISADNIEIDGVTLDTNANGELIIKDGGVDVTQIASTLETTNYDPDANTGWQINTAGTATFSDVNVRGEVVATQLNVQDATISGSLKANELSDGIVKVASISQAVWNEIESRVGSTAASTGYFKTASGNLTGGDLTLTSGSTAVTHATGQTVYFELDAIYFWSSATSVTGDDLLLDVTFEYDDNSSFSSPTTAHTALVTVERHVYFNGFMYDIDSSVQYELTGLAAGDYYYRVKLEPRGATPNAFSIAYLGVPVTFEVNEAGTGSVATGGNADTVDGYEAAELFRLGASGSTIDNTAYGNQIFTGDVTVTGTLSLQGSIDQYNVTDLEVVDKTITVNSGNTQALSDGAGLIVDRGTASDASILWDETNDEFDFSHNLSTAGQYLDFTGGGGYVGTTTAHALRLQTNDTEALRLTSGQDAVFAGDITLSTGNAIYFDGSTGTYITESEADVLKIVVGGDEFMRFTEGTNLINVYDPMFVDGDANIQNVFRIRADGQISNQDFTAATFDFNFSGTETHTVDNYKYGLYIDFDSTDSGGDTANETRLFPLYIDARNNAGGTADRLDAAYIYARNDGSANMANLRGIFSYAFANNSAGTTTNVYGIQSYGYDDSSGSGSVSTVVGTYSLGYASGTGTGTLASVYGAWNMAVSDSSNTKNITSMYGARNEVQLDSTSNAHTITNVYATFADIDENDADDQHTVTNGYLYYGQMSGTLPTNAYGIYIATDIENYFAGDITSAGDIQSSKFKISSDTEHSLSYLTTSAISGASVHVSELRGRQIDLYAYDDIYLRAGTSDSIYLYSAGNATLTLDSSSNATFTGHVSLSDSKYVRLGDDNDFIIYHDGATNYIQTVKQDSDLIIRGNDGGTNFNALTIDMSAGGNATFAGSISSGAITSSGNIVAASGHVQSYGAYFSHHLRVLNSAGNAWNQWATRNNGNFDLSVGTISSGVHTITHTGTIGGATVANGYLKITDGTDTLAFDPNEIMSTDRLFLNSADGEIFLRGNNSAGAKLFNGGTQFMSASRNLLNIGTISSGAHTLTSGHLQINDDDGYIRFASTLNWDLGPQTSDASFRIRTNSGANRTVYLENNGSGNLNLDVGGVINVNSGTVNIVATFESTDAGSYINLIDNGSGTYGAMIGAISDDIVFSPNNVERVRIQSSGNVGIGEDSPDYTLHVKSGTTNVVAKFESTDSTSVIQFVDNNGNCEFGTTGSVGRISPNGSYAVLEASQSSVVINNAAQDCDFRVEGTSQPNMLVVDAAENKVGINRTPNISNSKLEVGGADDVPLINVEASGVTGGMGIGSTGLQFFHGQTAQMRIDSSGNATFEKNLTVSNGTLRAVKTGDAFPEIEIARTGGSSFTNQEWRLSVGSTGNFNLNSATSGSSYYPFIATNSGDVYLATDTSGLNPSVFIDQSSKDVRFYGDIRIPVATNMYFGASDHTYIGEDIDDRLRFFTGGAEFMRFTEATNNQLDIFQPTVMSVTNPSANAFKLTVTDSDPLTNRNGILIDYNGSGNTALTADVTHNAIKVDMDVTSTGGNTTDEYRAYGIYSDVRGTGDTDLRYAMYGYSETQHSAGQVSDNVGVYGFAVADDTGTGHTSNNTGGKFLAYAYNTGTGGTTNHYGVYSKVLLTSAADKNTNAATGVYGEIEVDDSGTATTLTNAYVFRSEFDQDSTDTTVTNGYLYYGNYAGTLPNSAYGVYIVDDVRNYFGGHITTARGSASTAAYGFNGDTNTGMFSVEDHTLSWATNGAEEMRLTAAGNLHVDGNITAYSTTVSDRRLKSQITNISNALDKVGQINGVSFVRNHNGEKAAGVVAQEIIEVLPEAVKSQTLPLQTKDESTEYYVVEYDAVTGLLVEAVKELKARVEALDKQQQTIDQLIKRIEGLENGND